MKSTPFVRRPVSPIEAEPLIVAAEDILCPASDTEDSLESHKSKRRRIEAQAQRYREGKPLFIQSAILRGPLDMGWINPWARKPRQKRSGILRIPDQTNIVDLTEADPRPTLPQAVTRQERALNDGLSSRASVISDLGPLATRALVPVAQRAESNEIGRQPMLRNGDHTIVGQPSARTRDWLKSDIKYLNGGRERELKSPTPTPMATLRLRPPIPIERTVSMTPINRDIRRSSTRLPQDLQKLPTGFTPVNKQKPSADISYNRVMDIDEIPGPQLIREQQSPIVPADPQSSLGVGHRETVLDEADEATKIGFFGAKALAQEAIQNLQDEEGHSEARRLSQQAALVASQSAITPVAQHLGTLEPTSVTILNPPPVEEAVATEQSNAISKKLQYKNSPRAIPPSSNLAEFQYRIARKKAPLLENAANPSPFAQALRVAKAEAEAKKTKHLSFTSTGARRSFGSSSNSRDSSVETARSRPSHQDLTYSQEDGPRKSGLARSTLSSHTDQEVDNPPSNVLLEGPEAQVVQPPAAPSGPSTDILETDKQPLNFLSTEEGEEDSYINLSTQAALAKAQQSFQDALSPMQGFSKHRILANGSQLSPTAYKTPNGSLPAILQSSRPGIPNEDPVLTPDEAPTTQAMMDAMSPFALTTAKKKTPPPGKSPPYQKRASFAHSPLPSPSHTFGTTRRSLSMSTSSSESLSPTPLHRSPKRNYPGSKQQPPPILTKTSTGLSKPLSTATSTAFSIAPNGTLTEIYQQDGQQQYQIGMGLANSSSWDLDQALEEAGSFLETLDVEAEARKGGTTATTGLIARNRG